ncbi:Winged helix DNA-binding domain-containing protein [Paenibacillus catalpae]|uniref:Winged helix DNA-binding domain-containing protein n=1 Tax=Paenibacillus catalpae TaxID=1045775 RepID=A0A1I2FRA8_9BACL|nr:winged helix DNA-binding domain-containing protein [Paenibacillus catalpae]SFF07160.1 Winged helix DNA-binding domain-containing protein [Paenibacillus catalpae]
MNRQAAKISSQELNRALLARQMLLSRSDMPVLNVLEWFIGLQAQAPHAPYYSLWTRLEGFDQAQLSALISERQAVRIALMRSTLHLVSAKDCLLIRPWVQTVHERAHKAAFGKRLAGVDLEAVIAEGRKLVEEQPRTFSELGKLLAESRPGIDPEALATAVRTYVPLIQIPPRGLWGESGQATHTTVNLWLGQPLAEQPDADRLILRYLAAYGPATVKDMQAWSGLTRLKEYFERLRPQLITFQDEHGNELFDVPDAPRPDAGVDPPARFLGEFDQMLLGIADRSRIMDHTYAKRIFTANGILRSTILLNGYIEGIWSIVRDRRKAALIVDPFRALTKEEQHELTQEGQKLLEFAAEGFDHEIRFN